MHWLKRAKDYIQEILYSVYRFSNVVFGRKTGWVEDIEASYALVHIRRNL
jgi:hypothetical protein